jgi:hypothetical protein
LDDIRDLDRVYQILSFVERVRSQLANPVADNTLRCKGHRALNFDGKLERGRISSLGIQLQRPSESPLKRRRNCRIQLTGGGISPADNAHQAFLLGGFFE